MNIQAVEWISTLSSPELGLPGRYFLGRTWNNVAQKNGQNNSVSERIYSLLALSGLLAKL